MKYIKIEHKSLSKFLDKYDKFGIIKKDNRVYIKFMEDFLSSYLVSVIPDGDYYSYSKLYKIEGLYNPKVIEIKETQGLFKFIIKIC